jgi:hypothetical protein
MKKIVMVACVLMSCPMGKAQVSCSPKIPKDTCQEVATLFDPFLRRETHVKGGSQLELLSSSEYKVRIDQIKRKGLTEVESLLPPGCGSAPEKLVFQNCSNEYVVFFRDNSEDLVPKHILVSGDAVLFKNKTSESGIFMLLNFVKGYYEGLEAVYGHESCSGSSPLSKTELCE